MDNATLQAIEAASNTRIAWCLSLLGGSILALVSSGFEKPQKCRSIYLLFMLGWILLVASIYYGDSLCRRVLMAMMHPERLETISDKINDDYYNQIHWFNLGFGCLGVWLLLYLFLWIFYPKFFIKP